MAIYRLSLKSGAVGKGKSHAKYICAKDKYSHKSDMEKVEEFNIPGFAKNGIEFFEAADNHERSNGRTYREFEISLARELSHEQNKNAIMNFVFENKLENQPMIIAYHKGKNGDNPHAHLMFSERPNLEVDQDLFFKRNGSKKDRTFNSKEWLKDCRISWEKHLNKELAQLNKRIKKRVSHKSLKARGIDRKPQPKIGYVAMAIERRLGQSSRVQKIKDFIEKHKPKKLSRLRSRSRSQDLDRGL